MVSRDVAFMAHRVADHLTDRIADAARPGQRVATVTTVTAGGASDGNALVKVTYRGTEFQVQGYNSAYTPAVGHRVVCDVIDAQWFVSYHFVGLP